MGSAKIKRTNIMRPINTDKSEARSIVDMYASSPPPQCKA